MGNGKKKHPQSLRDALFLLVLGGILLTISLGITTLFNDIKSRYIHFQNNVWADVVYLVFLILLFLLLFYVFQRGREVDLPVFIKNVGS